MLYHCEMLYYLPLINRYSYTALQNRVQPIVFRGAAPSTHNVHAMMMDFVDISSSNDMLW